MPLSQATCTQGLLTRLTSLAIVQQADSTGKLLASLCPQGLPNGPPHLSSSAVWGFGRHCCCLLAATAAAAPTARAAVATISRKARDAASQLAPHRTGPCQGAPHSSPRMPSSHCVSACALSPGARRAAGSASMPSRRMRLRRKLRLRLRPGCRQRRTYEDIRRGCSKRSCAKHSRRSTRSTHSMHIMCSSLSMRSVGFHCSWLRGQGPLHETASILGEEP